MPDGGALDALVDTLTTGNSPAISAIYLFGSQHEGTALPTSDIDIAVVIDQGESEPSETALRARINATDAANVDIVMLRRSDLLRDGHFRIERCSQLLFGQDVRPLMPRTTLASYLQHYAPAPLTYIGPVLRQEDHPVNPLDYPDPTGEFFGYDRALLPPNGLAIHNIKTMVACACWIATLVVGFRTGRMICSPADGVQAHRERINDEWTKLINDIYQYGRQRWHYTVPASAIERDDLRELCRQMLYLERYYLDFQTGYPA